MANDRSNFNNMLIGLVIVIGGIVLLGVLIFVVEIILPPSYHGPSTMTLSAGLEINVKNLIFMIQKIPL